jgi:hypothetical protein
MPLSCRENIPSIMNATQEPIKDSAVVFGHLCCSGTGLDATFKPEDCTFQEVCQNFASRSWKQPDNVIFRDDDSSSIRFESNQSNANQSFSPLPTDRLSFV